MLHRNGPSMQVGKYFSCLLGYHCDITAAIRQWRRRCSACVQAGGGHFEHHFSHALFICILVD